MPNLRLLANEGSCSTRWQSIAVGGGREKGSVLPYSRSPLSPLQPFAASDGEFFHLRSTIERIELRLAHVVVAIFVEDLLVFSREHGFRRRLVRMPNPYTRLS